MTTPVGVDTQPPSTPTNLFANAVSGTQINLSWTASTDNVGVTDYLIERCQGTGCSNFTQIATSTTTSFSNTGLTATPPTATGSAPPTPPATIPLLQHRDRHHPRPRQPAADRTRQPDRRPATAPRDRPRLGRRHRQRQRHQLPIERCQGANCTTFNQQATTNGTDPHLQRHQPHPEHQLQLPPPRHRPLRQPIPLLQHRHRHHPRRHPTTDRSRHARRRQPFGAAEIDLGWGPATDDVGVTGYRIDRCQGAGCTNFCAPRPVDAARRTPTRTSDLAAGDELHVPGSRMDAAGNLGAVSNSRGGDHAASADAALSPRTAFDEGSGTTVADSSGNGNNGDDRERDLDDRGQVRQRARRSTARTPRVTIPDCGLAASDDRR